MGLLLAVLAIAGLAAVLVTVAITIVVNRITGRKLIAILAGGLVLPTVLCLGAIALALAQPDGPPSGAIPAAISVSATVAAPIMLFISAITAWMAPRSGAAGARPGGGRPT